MSRPLRALRSQPAAQQEPTGPLRIWHGIEACDPPMEADNHLALLAMAETMLDQRQRRFPAMVQAGRLTEQEAAAEIAAFRALASHWRWIVCGDVPRRAYAELLPAAMYLGRSIQTIAGIAREESGFSTRLAEQAHRVIALAHNLDPAVHPALIDWAQRCHSARAAQPPVPSSTTTSTSERNPGHAA